MFDKSYINISVTTVNAEGTYYFNASYDLYKDFEKIFVSWKRRMMSKILYLISF